MKILIITILFLVLAVPLYAQNYYIDWYTISAGGGHSESDNFQSDGTIGQALVGQASSENYTIETGYWVVYDTVGIAYLYLPGDANMYNGQWPPTVIGGDVTYLVNYFRGLTSSQSCLLDGFWASADVNGDCNIIGSDVTKLVSYFRGVGVIQYCPAYPPEYPPIPPSAPSGWPDCETAAAGNIVPTDSNK